MQYNHFVNEETLDESDRIEILIPAYNCDEYITECLESVLAQTFTDFTVTVLDDCSSDSTSSVVQSYAKQNHRINLIQNTSNLGVAKCRELLVRQAKSDYICFVDADDWIEPTFLEALVSLSDNFSRDICWVDYIQEFPKRKFLSPASPNQKFSSTEELLHYLFGVYNLSSSGRFQLWGTIIRTEIAKRIDWTACEYLFSEDIIRAARIVLLSNTGASKNAYLYHWRMHEESLTHQDRSAALNNDKYDQIVVNCTLGIELSKAGFVGKFYSDLQNSMFLKSIVLAIPASLYLNDRKKFDESRIILLRNLKNILKSKFVTPKLKFLALSGLFPLWAIVPLYNLAVKLQHIVKRSESKL